MSIDILFYVLAWGFAAITVLGHVLLLLAVLAEGAPGLRSRRRPPGRGPFLAGRGDPGELAGRGDQVKLRHCSAIMCVAGQAQHA